MFQSSLSLSGRQAGRGNVQPWSELEQRPSSPASLGALATSLRFAKHAAGPRETFAWTGACASVASTVPLSSFPASVQSDYEMIIETILP